MFPVKIAGLGVYLPSNKMTSAELATRLKVSADWIERATGVRERRYAQHETTVQMAALAARKALNRAEMEPGSIDLIVGASTVPQQLIPCTAALVQRELGMADGSCLSFDINATCVSFLIALFNVAPLIAAGVYKRVLIFSSEIASVGINPAEPESAALFGDAAVAAILTRSDGPDDSSLFHSRFETHASGADFTECRGGGSLHHPNKATTKPEYNLFHMRGREVYRMAARTLGPFLDNFFADLPFCREEVDKVVPHQASRKGIGLLTDRYGFRQDQIVSNLETRGNCVAASIPLAFAEAVEAGQIKRGQRVLLIGTGAGLTLAAIALRF